MKEKGIGLPFLKSLDYPRNSTVARAHVDRLGLLCGLGLLFLRGVAVESQMPKAMGCQLGVGTVKVF